MTYARLAQRLFNTPLLITADKLDVLDHVLRAYDEGRAKLLSPYEKKERPELATNGAPQRTQAGYMRTAQGVAIIPILGTLVQRTGGMDAESGLTSYAEIGAQVAAAISDPQTRGILLEIDSSGGEANGVFDLAAEIRAAGAQKPIYAHANEQAFSAAYALASAAEAVYAPRIGMVGSIGARMRHVDQSQYDAKRGFVYTDIVSGERKADMNPHAPLSDPAREFMQDHVDRLGAVFNAHVADMRGIDEQAVRDTRAGLIHADDAANLGLIDGVASINDTMQLLLDRIASNAAPTYGMRAAARATAPAVAALSFTQGETEMDQKELDAKLAAAKAEGEAAGKAAAEATAKKELTEAQTSAAAAAAKAAQERVAAILGHAEAAGRASLAQHIAFKTSTLLEDAVAMLAAAPKEAAAVTANQFAEYMAKLGNPKLLPDAAASGGAADGSGKPGITPPVAATVYAFRRQCVANARAGK